MNIIIDIINWIVVYWLLPLLPTNLPGIPYDTFISTLTGLQNTLIFTMSVLNNFFNIYLLLGLIVLILSAEIILFLFKTINWLLNIVRGAGA